MYFCCDESVRSHPSSLAALEFRRLSINSCNFLLYIRCWGLKGSQLSITSKVYSHDQEKIKALYSISIYGILSITNRRKEAKM